MVPVSLSLVLVLLLVRGGPSANR